MPPHVHFAAALMSSSGTCLAMRRQKQNCQRCIASRRGDADHKLSSVPGETSALQGQPASLGLGEQSLGFPAMAELTPTSALLSAPTSVPREGVVLAGCPPHSLPNPGDAAPTPPPFLPLFYQPLQTNTSMHSHRLKYFENMTSPIGTHPRERKYCLHCILKIESKVPDPYGIKEE